MPACGFWLPAIPPAATKQSRWKLLILPAKGQPNNCRSWPFSLHQVPLDSGIGCSCAEGWGSGSIAGPGAAQPLVHPPSECRQCWTCGGAMRFSLCAASHCLCLTPCTPGAPSALCHLPGGAGRPGQLCQRGAQTCPHVPLRRSLFALGRARSFCLHRDTVCARNPALRAVPCSCPRALTRTVCHPDFGCWVQQLALGHRDPAELFARVCWSRGVWQGPPKPVGIWDCFPVGSQSPGKVLLSPCPRGLRQSVNADLAEEVPSPSVAK